MKTRELDNLDLLIHRLIGGWALNYRVPMTQPALDAIEDQLRTAFQSYGDARAAEMRERCAQIADRSSSPAFYTKAAQRTARYIAASIRELDK